MKEKKNTQSKVREKLELKKVYNQKLKEKGITLIALVVTIVILLILSGITLNITLSGNGLFSRAQNAADKYKKAQEDEQNAIEQLAEELENINIDYNDYVGAFVTGYNPESKTCTIGTTTSGVSKDEKDSSGSPIENIKENGDQIFKTEEMRWRIWDYNGRILRLISSKPTTAKLTLKGAAGYNNGVWAVNEICRQCYGQYNEDGSMIEGVSVANLRRSDIQKVTKYDYTGYSHDNTGTEDKNGEGIYKYGNAKTYSSNNSYPTMWGNNDENWKYYKNGNNSGTESQDLVKTDGTDNTEDKEGLIWEREGTSNGQMTGSDSGDTNTEFKQSYWRHDYDTSTAKEEDWINTKYYDLLFGDSSNRFNVIYWLASRYVFLNSEYCDFGEDHVWSFPTSCFVAGDALYFSSR